MEEMRLTRRSLVGMLALVFASCTLVLRVHSLRTPPPPIELAGRARELALVRAVAKRVRLYAEAYGHPLYRWDLVEGRYAVNVGPAYVSEAESTQVAALRAVLFRGDFSYGYDDGVFFVGWPAIHTRTVDSIAWPAPAAAYARMRRLAIAPNPRLSVRH